MTVLLCALYFFVGSALVHGRMADIAMDVPNPEDPISGVSTLLRWVLTWPLWVRRRG